MRRWVLPVASSMSIVSLSYLLLFESQAGGIRAVQAVAVVCNLWVLVMWIRAWRRGDV